MSAAAREPWRSHTVAEKKAAGIIPTYFNNHINHYNAFDVGRQVTHSDTRSLDERIEDAKENIIRINEGSSTILDLSNLNLNDISDLPGVSTALRRIVSLYCDGNNLTDLPNLQVTSPRLRVLICSRNTLTSLPPLPDTVSTLRCDNNLLRSLPRPLPRFLITLHCSNNQLLYLPPLPSGLQLLYCGNNQIRELPTLLPEGLINLLASDNNIKVIPRLPRSLSFMRIDRNPLEEPFRQFLTNHLENASDVAALVTLTRNYWDHQTLEVLGQEMVNPESHLSAGTGKPDRVGYGLPVGPDSLILEGLGITNGRESFNSARTRLRTKVNPSPLAAVNTNLFKGGKRHRRTKRSKKSRRHTRRKTV